MAISCKDILKGNGSRITIDKKIFLSNGMVFCSSQQRLLCQIPRSYYYTLAYLYNHQGFIISKEELVAHLKEHHINCSEKTMVVTISKLKKYLDSSSIQTVRKFGYMFNLSSECLEIIKE